MQSYWAQGISEDSNLFLGEVYPGSIKTPRHSQHIQTMTAQEACEKITEMAAHTEWVPTEEYSVFNQYDCDFYSNMRREFTYKYKALMSMARVLAPASITELGTCAGAAVDSYIEGAGTEFRYVGYDLFRVSPTHRNTGEPWAPKTVAKRLFAEKGLENYELIETDIRALTAIERSDLISVDAAHDYRSSYRDTRLAIKAGPSWVHVDDYDGAGLQATADILVDFADVIDSSGVIDYIYGGGLLIKMKEA